MKAISKRRFIALLAVMMLIVASIGITTAYFSDTDKAEGAATLNLKGETKIEEGDKDFKQIVITNTGKADLLVRVKLFGVDKKVDDKKVLNVSVPGAWANGDGGWYYFRTILPGDKSPQATTGAPIEVKLNDELTPKEIAELGDSFDVTVVHEATPVVYKEGKLVLPEDWTLPSGVPAAQ